MRTLALTTTSKFYNATRETQGSHLELSRWRPSESSGDSVYVPAK